MTGGQRCILPATRCPSELAASGRLPPERLTRQTRLTRRVGARAAGRMTDPQPFNARRRASRVQRPLHRTGRRDPGPPAPHGPDQAPAHASMAPHREIKAVRCHQSAPRPLEAVIPCRNHDRVLLGLRRQVGQVDADSAGMLGSPRRARRVLSAPPRQSGGGSRYRADCRSARRRPLPGPGRSQASSV